MQWTCLLICCRMGVKWMVMLGVSGRWWYCEIEREWQWLVQLDRIWHAFCIKCIKFTVKYFTFIDVFNLRDHPRV
jgi:hypothetical protein